MCISQVSKCAKYIKADCFQIISNRLSQINSLGRTNCVNSSSIPIRISLWMLPKTSLTTILRVFKLWIHICKPWQVIRQWILKAKPFFFTWKCLSLKINQSQWFKQQMSQHRKIQKTFCLWKYSCKMSEAIYLLRWGNKQFWGTCISTGGCIRHL